MIQSKFAYNWKWVTLVIQLSYNIILVQIVVDLVSLVLCSDDQVILHQWVDLYLSVQQDRSQHSILLLEEGVEAVLVDVLDVDLFLLSGFIVDESKYSLWNVIDSEHISLCPWVELMDSLESHFQCLKEDFRDGDRSKSCVGVLPRLLHQGVLVFLDDRGVELA